MREKTPRIFVSHNHADADWCQAFVAALEQQGYDTWYYEGKLGPSDAFIPTIQKEIADRQVFMVILTPKGWESVWVQREFELALYYKRRIIPILLKTTTTEGFINTFQNIDVRGYDAASAAHRVITDALDPHYEPPKARQEQSSPEKVHHNPQPPGDPWDRFRP